MPPLHLSVGDLNRLVATCLANPKLQDLEVEGEISQLKRYPSGHVYFTLKDSRAAVSCVLFASEARHLGPLPAEGERVTALGRVGLYERDGRYQLYVRGLRRAGYGQLWLAFEAMKKRLEAAGYFDPAHKKALPFLPRRIGVVTSPAGAVIRDIIQVATRRLPGIQVILYPVHVQGRMAAGEIATGIRVFNALKNVDLLIVGRGGGSLEDLWPFNEEVVAAAIYQSELPVISAVGHETDFSISDYTADLRAPTPSAAAELALPRRADLEGALADERERLQRSIERLCAGEKRTAQLLKGRLLQNFRHRFREESLYLDSLLQRPVLQDPRAALHLRSVHITRLGQLLERGFASHLRLAGERAARLREKQQQAWLGRLQAEQWRLCSAKSNLRSLSPWRILQRGYAAVTDEAGQLLTRRQQIAAGSILHLQFADGRLRAEALAEEDQEIYSSDSRSLPPTSRGNRQKAEDIEDE